MTSGNGSLSKHQGLAVCQHLDCLGNTGVPALFFMIMDCADAGGSDGPPPQVSIGLEPHLEYPVRKQRVQEIDRKNAQDPDIFQEQLRKFKAICNEYGIPPHDIDNFDESGFRIDVGWLQPMNCYL